MSIGPVKEEDMDAGVLRSFINSKCFIPSNFRCIGSPSSYSLAVELADPRSAVSNGDEPCEGSARR